jgi:hypothetical protein
MHVAAIIAGTIHLDQTLDYVFFLFWNEVLLLSGGQVQQTVSTHCGNGYKKIADYIFTI